MTEQYNESVSNLKNVIESVYEQKSNKTSSWNNTTNDTRYPTEKLVKDSLDSKADSSHTHSNYLTNSDITGKANKSELAVVATSGDYEDLTNKPSIPNIESVYEITSNKGSANESKLGKLYIEIKNNKRDVYYITKEENYYGYIWFIEDENNKIKLIGDFDNQVRDKYIYPLVYIDGSLEIMSPLEYDENNNIWTQDFQNTFYSSDTYYICISDASFENNTYMSTVPNDIEYYLSEPFEVYDENDELTVFDIVGKFYTWHRLDDDVLDSLSINWSNIQNKPSIPSKTSDLTNDSGFLTSHQDITGKEDISNKSSSITTDTSSTTKYPTVKAVEDYAQPKGNYLTSHQDISGKADKSGYTASKNLVTNSSGQITTEDKPIIPSKTSDLTNDSGFLTSHQDISGKADITDIPTKVSELTNDSGFLTSHQDITGKEDTSNKSSSITTDTGSTSKYPTVKAVEDYAQPIGNYLTSHQSLDSKTVTVEKQSTAETGYVATYIIKQNNSQVGSKINIPKDYLVKSATINTCSTTGTPTGFTQGDKYIDFVINTKDSSGTDEHIYLDVNDLVDAYTAGAGLELTNSNEIKHSNSITAQTSTVFKKIKYDAQGHITGTADVDSSDLPSHTHSQYLTSHQDISGKADKSGYTASKNLVTDSNGAITTEDKPTIPSASSSTPSADINGGAIGSSSNYAKADHQHPLSSAYATASHNQASSTITDMSTVQVVVTYTDDTTEILNLFKQVNSQ